jgi:hypothetical protein
MGVESHDGFDAPSSWFVYQERRYDRADAGLKNVSPKGIGSGMRMLTYFINRAGPDLSPKRRAELNKAKVLLSSGSKSQGVKKRSQGCLISKPPVDRKIDHAR